MYLGGGVLEGFCCAWGLVCGTKTRSHGVSGCWQPSDESTLSWQCEEQRLLVFRPSFVSTGLFCLLEEMSLLSDKVEEISCQIWHFSLGFDLFTGDGFIDDGHGDIEPLDPEGVDIVLQIDRCGKVL